MSSWSVNFSLPNTSWRSSTYLLSSYYFHLFLEESKFWSIGRRASRVNLDSVTWSSLCLDPPFSPFHNFSEPITLCLLSSSLFLRNDKNSEYCERGNKGRKAPLMLCTRMHKRSNLSNSTEFVLADSTLNVQYLEFTIDLGGIGRSNNQNKIIIYYMADNTLELSLQVGTYYFIIFTSKHSCLGVEHIIQFKPMNSFSHERVRFFLRRKSCNNSDLA